MAMRLLNNVICGMVELPCRHFKQATSVSVTAILITNGMVHFDNALYACLIPFRRAFWLHHEGAFHSLIILYSLLSLSFVAKLVVLALIGRFFLFEIPGATRIRYALSGVGIGSMGIGLLSFWAETPMLHGIGIGFSSILVDVCASTVYHFLGYISWSIT